MLDKPLLSVPNVSEGRRRATIEAIAEAFSADGAARLLDVHSDADHHRSVFTLAGSQGTLANALLDGALVAVESIDVGEDREPAEIGAHPHVGAVDVVPLVYLDLAQRGAACAEALVVAAELGERLGLPVLLYGELAGGRTRAQLRRGGVAGLARRLRDGELLPDFGPRYIHPTAGATLVCAREPLVAFNLELAPPASVDDAKRIASVIREGGVQGLPGLRAIGVPLHHARKDALVGDGDRAGESGGRGGSARRGESAGRGRSARRERSARRVESAGFGESKNPVPRARAGGTPSGDIVAQLSMNVERPLELPLASVIEVVRKHADVARAEIVGLAPRAALEGFPADVALQGFDPGVHVIENALGF
jgi:glutamate formiminotransferase/glutamate formiminotransferase/formiminotetrahydrofolate cyclodeaminase